MLHDNISMICGYLSTGEKRVIEKQREFQDRTKNGAELPIQLGITEVCTKGDSKWNH
jgi:hypothetical protein